MEYPKLSEPFEVRIDDITLLQDFDVTIHDVGQAVMKTKFWLEKQHMDVPVVEQIKHDEKKWKVISGYVTFLMAHTLGRRVITVKEIQHERQVCSS